MESSQAKSSGLSASWLAPYLYPFLFVPLDAATRVIQSPEGVVPWYPPLALTVVLLVFFGLRYVLIAFVTIVACNYFIWDFPPGPLNLGPLFLSFVSVSLYSAAAAWLRYGARLQSGLARLRDAAWFVFAIVPTSIAAGLVYAAYLLSSGTIGRGAFVATVRDFALGDMIGIFTLAPALFLIVRFVGGTGTDSERVPASAASPVGMISNLRWSRRRFLEFAAWTFLMVGSLWIALDEPGDLAGSRLYLTFVPLIWAALRTGNRGSAAAVLLIACLTVGQIVYQGYQADIPEIQLYLLALALTGLSLGAAVTEHKRAHEMWRRYEFIANALGEQTALIDRDYRFEAVNDAFCRAHGVDRGEVVGQPIARLWGEDAYEFTIRDYVTRCFEGRKEITEGWYRTGAAGRRYYRFEYSPYVEVERRISHCVMVAHDLTDKLLARQAQEKTENLYRRAIAASEAVPYVRNYSGGKDEFLFMGPEIERLTGYSREELTTDRWESIQLEVDTFGELGGLPYEEAVSRTRAGEFKYWRSDNRIRTKDGSERWITDASVEVQDDEGVVVGCIGMLSDITERKQSEEALRQSEERLELALRGADLGLWDWDLTNDRLIVNDRFAEMLGYAPGELIEAGYVMRSRIHPDDRAVVSEIMRQHIAGETPAFEAEYRVQHRSGEDIWVLNRGRVFERNERGEPLRALGTHLDITQRHAIEDERRKLEMRILHAQKLESLGILAGGIAHDFNNLLVGILGNADLAMLERVNDGADQEYLAAIVTSAQRAAELCRQMLAYSGKGHFIVRPIDLNEVVREMAHLLSVSVSKRVSLHYNFATPMPAVEVDVTQMRQIIMNLITNASEAIGDADGEIIIRTSTQYLDGASVTTSYWDEDLEPGAYVVLEIADTGCGMDGETLARIFDPFFTTKFTGRGLGMAAVLGIVRGHHGAVDVQSAIGKGTTFTVLLPASSKAPDSHVSDPDVNLAWKGTGTVLVVEDEPEVLALVEKLLKRAGFDPILCRDGQEAVELFRKQADSIRFVLLDMTMPRMSCAETVRALQAIRQDVPIILTSGYSESEAAQTFEKDGIAGFLQKPYRAATLYDVVRAAIER